MHMAWESVCSIEHVRVAASAALAVVWVAVSAVVAAVRAFNNDDLDPDAGERDGSTSFDPFRLALLSLT